MPHFRCTACHRRVFSPVVIGAGDCPHCGGDVVFDVHGDPPKPEAAAGKGPLRSLLGRMRRR